MSDLVRFFLLGLGPGAIYALLAIGMVLIYRGSGVLNFSSGGLALLSAAVFMEVRATPLGTPGAVAAGILAAAGAGALIQVLILYPMRRAAPITRVVATLGVLVAVELGAELRYGVQPRFAPSFLPSGSVRVFGGAVIAADRFVILGVAAVLTIVLAVVYRVTKFGIATTGVAESPRATAATGWSAARIAALNWAFGGALAGVAGVLLAPLIGFAPTSFTLTVVPTLAVAVIAGFRSFPLALLGGLLIGVLESEGAYVQARYSDGTFAGIPTHGLSTAIPFIVIIALMVGRGRALPVRGYITDRLPRLGNGVPRPRIIVAVACCVCASLWVFTPGWASAVSLSATVALIGLSVVVVTGYAGQLSLTQYALAGFCALVSSRLADAAGFSFLLAAIAGVTATVLIGLLVALPAVRVRGVNLAVVTLGLAVVIESMILSNPDFNGGAVRGTRVPDPTVFGINVQSVQHPELWAATCLVVLLASALGLANLRRSRTGRRLIAVRDNERAAASLGVSVIGAKLHAFAVGAAFAGLGGVLLAFRNTSVSFEQYGAFSSVEIVLLTVIGGVGFIAGALIAGAAVVSGIVHNILGHVWGTDLWFRFILSLLFLVAIVVHPDGIAEKVSHAFDRRRRSRSTPDEGAPSLQRVPAARVEPVRAMTLEIRGLSVRFGGVKALEDVHLTVAPGEVVGLIGPNGAGKTTLVDAVTGFVSPFAGEILLDGRRIDSVPAPARARAGLTRSFQSLELFEDLSVADNLRIASDNHRMIHFVKDLFWPGHQELPMEATAAIQEFDLESVLDRRPAELPYAQRRAVGIARAVATSPSVLLLDEPAAGLDVVARRELEHLIRRLADEWKMGVLLIEHDVSLVMRACDRVVMLDFGKVLASGTPEEVRNNEAVVSAYIGGVADPHGQEVIA